MPVYRIKEKFWFWDAAYFIQDEKGNNMYSLHKKWFAMDSAVEMKDEQQHEGEETEDENNAPRNNKKETLLTIRKKILSFGTVYQVVRNDDTVVAEIKEKRVWLQQKHVLELADVEYIVDESKWHKKVFSIQHKGFEIAHVSKKMLDMSGSFWVDINVDPTYYEGEALKDMCATVLAACIIMIEVLCDNDRQALKEEKARKRQEKLDKMPVQELHDS